MSEGQKMDTPEQEAFRVHCKEWLANNHPGRPTVKLPLGALELSDPEALAWLQKWQKSAYDAGLIGCDYPIYSLHFFPNKITQVSRTRAVLHPTLPS